VVERQLPKLYVVGSIPIARSRFLSAFGIFSALPRKRNHFQSRPMACPISSSKE
jgi:hypothetical protein